MGLFTKNLYSLSLSLALIFVQISFDSISVTSAGDKHSNGVANCDLLKHVMGKNLSQIRDD